MRRIVSLVSAVFVLSGIAAAPARADDMDTCKNARSEDLIAACTRLIDSKKLRGGELANVYVLRGSGYARFKRDFDRAIADYTEALKLDPKNARGYGFRGGVHVRKGNLDRALTDLNEARRLDPRLPATYANLAAYYNAKGDYNRAVTEASEAIRLYHQHIYAFLHRGVGPENRGEFNKALADFRTARSYDPGKREVGGQDASEGIARVEQKIAAIGASDWGSCFNWPIADEKIGACTRLISGGKLRGDDLAQAYFRRGLNYASVRDDFDHAIADFNETLRLDPKHAFALAVRGAAFVRKGNLDRGLADLNEALRLDPKHGTVHANFGLYYNAKGDYDRALLSLNEALRINSNNAFAYRSRGETFEHKGEFAAALADFRVALSLDPEKKVRAGRDAAEGIRRVEQKIAAGGAAKVAVATPTPAPTVASPSPAPLGRRVALVIGNAGYKHAAKLANPANDAGDIALALRKLGFDVVEGRDLDKRGMEDKIREFGGKLEHADLALFFYAGHGMQVGGKNYLVPIDAKLERAGDLSLDTIDVSQVLAQMEAEKRVNLVFLDACRDNPLARSFSRSLGTRSTSVGSGLASIQSAVGTMIAYATQPENVALDGDGRNSPFTAALLKHMATPSLEISALMKRVRADVIAATRDKQVPWDHSSLVGDVILAR